MLYETHVISAIALGDQMQLAFTKELYELDMPIFFSNWSSNKLLLLLQGMTHAVDLMLKSQLLICGVRKHWSLTISVE